jgi:glutathione peroxidase
MSTSIYDFTVKKIDGTLLQLDAYKGKVLLIVNTASRCGFTPQYEGLEALYAKYRAQGLEILAFPCNQFANQEPGDEKEIASFCKLTYDTSFPLFSKVDVRGKNAHPLFSFLTGSLRGLFFTKQVKWNFTKFLVDRDGNPVSRYAPATKPQKLEKDIERLLRG